LQPFTYIVLWAEALDSFTKDKDKGETHEVFSENIDSFTKDKDKGEIHKAFSEEYPCRRH
jgi:hypothetical protein